jgi:hypothetical protein
MSFSYVIQLFSEYQSTRKTAAVASSNWRPRENSSSDAKIASTISSAH